jgi:hypothetical protein
MSLGPQRWARPFPSLAFSPTWASFRQYVSSRRRRSQHRRPCCLHPRWRRICHGSVVAVSSALMRLCLVHASERKDPGRTVLVCCQARGGTQRSYDGRQRRCRTWHAVCCFARKLNLSEIARTTWRTTTATSVASTYARTCTRVGLGLLAVRGRQLSALQFLVS